MVKIKIVKNDTKTVAKVILIDQSDRVLFLKRAENLEKFAGEWDLPGGHLKEGESLPMGLSREVLEETGLELRDPVFLSNIDNLHFFYAMYDSQPIKISHEHTDYRFFEKKDLNSNEKFQKKALEALGVINPNND